MFLDLYPEVLHRTWEQRVRGSCLGLRVGLTYFFFAAPFRDIKGVSYNFAP